MGVHLPSIYVIEGCRAGGRKGATPPPPYDSPPPYHVAVVMAGVPDLVVSEPIVI